MEVIALIMIAGIATQPPKEAYAQRQDSPNVGKLDDLGRLIIIPDGGGFRSSNLIHGCLSLSSINQDLLELLHKKLAEINDLYLKENVVREKEAKEREEEAKRGERKKRNGGGRKRRGEGRKRREGERKRRGERKMSLDVSPHVEYLKSH
ncbi:hypothetical protein HAX54_008587 [Datura stramonium]|uniref:Uncharacterized protein n=1 Tax=Datura stramonium TaxID=4076 RepID=A0ABS8TEX8_DATST|nr:hypothetical protein [Datura stramonium]